MWQVLQAKIPISHAIYIVLNKATVLASNELDKRAQLSRFGTLLLPYTQITKIEYFSSTFVKIFAHTCYIYLR